MKKLFPTNPEDPFIEGYIGGEICPDAHGDRYDDYDEGPTEIRQVMPEGPVGYLGHFAQERYIRQGHNEMPTPAQQLEQATRSLPASPTSPTPERTDQFSRLLRSGGGRNIPLR